MRKQDPEYRKEFRMRKENGIFTYRWKPEEEAPILKITKSSLVVINFARLIISMVILMILIRKLVLL